MPSCLTIIKNCLSFNKNNLKNNTTSKESKIEKYNQSPGY